jgi:putative sigma-54 modulation protein
VLAAVFHIISRSNSMNIQFTARHFKARPELQQFAEETVRGLSQLYDGIVTADIVLEEEPHGDGRIAEISLLVYKDKLFAKEKSNDFVASLNACAEKIERQLHRYKDKLHDGRHASGRPEVEEPIAPEDGGEDLV